ncbi:hypothetical protein PSTT_04456 [Puccinia striiformis]|uniref:Uncharacterized protein n=1 Tax=Puccinia striiformis TaxID=27350 RepID=A0A2S4VSM1_9BASI|nr:hypothetical protein PSTT_04456 [Puccinia striiformis]
MCYLALQETEGLNASSPDLHQSLMSSKEVTKTDHPVSKKNCLNLNVALDINGEPLVPVSSISKIAPKRILLNLNVAFDIITKTSGKIGPNKKFQKYIGTNTMTNKHSILPFKEKNKRKQLSPLSHISNGTAPHRGFGEIYFWLLTPGEKAESSLFIPECKGQKPVTDLIALSEQMSRESDLQTYSLGWKASSSNTPTTCPFWADFRRLLMTMTSSITSQSKGD